MPWNPADADTHVKGLSAKQKRAWAAVANSARAKCIAGGGDGATCDASAIKQANATAQKVGEASQLAEARTLKAQAQQVLRDLHGILSDKGLAPTLRASLSAARDSLKAKWADLAGEGDTAPKPAAAASTEAERAVEAAEAILRRSASLDGVRDLVGQAIRDDLRTGSGGMDPYPWIRDLFAASVVYEFDGLTYQRTYTIDQTTGETKVILGDPAEVEVAYIPVGESAVPTPGREAADVELSGDLVPLVEKALRRDGTVPVKLIQPGWGSSGYYSAEVLKRDGPKVFTKGLHSFWNHPTVSEEADRPERSLSDLAGAFESDARWEDQGAAGPGLYADLKVFKPYRPVVEELAPHIGVSIRALGQATAGEAEGRKGQIIEKLVAGKSADFVTVPGAGGQVVSLFEAARGRAVSVEGDDVSVEELNALREAATADRQRREALEQEVAQLRERELLREARDVAATVLRGMSLPEPTTARLVEAQGRAPILKDGALDRAAFETRVKEAATAEVEYLQRVTGSGSIRGMGSTGTAAAEMTREQVDERLAGSFRALGLSEAAAKSAATGREG